MTNSKRGIAVPWNFDPNHFPLYTCPTITWASNWELWRPPKLPETIPHVPQVRTAKEVESLPDYLSNYEKDGTLSFLLGFNEPDIASQANLSVAQAVELWKRYFLPMKAKYPKLRIGSPAVSNGPEGLPWLRSFFTELGGVKGAAVDFICLHFYSPDVSVFKTYVEEAHKEFGMPIWVTEFGCTNWNPGAPVDKETVLGFCKESIDWMDQKDWVERYAWFGAMEDVGEAVGRHCGLQDRDGKKLTETGKLYVKA